MLILVGMNKTILLSLIIILCSTCSKAKQEPISIEEPGSPVSTQEPDSPNILYLEKDSKTEIIADDPVVTLEEGVMGKDSYSYDILLNTQPTAEVEIKITLPAEAPDDLSISSGIQNENGADSFIILTFAIDDWDSSQTVTLTLMDNSIEEGNRNLNIDHIVRSSDEDYNGNHLDHTIRLTLKDNDSPGITYSRYLPLSKDYKDIGDSPIKVIEGQSSFVGKYLIETITEPTHDVHLTISMPDTAPPNLQLHYSGDTISAGESMILILSENGFTDNFFLGVGFTLSHSDTNTEGIVIVSHSTESDDSDYDQLSHEIEFQLINDSIARVMYLKKDSSEKLSNPEITLNEGGASFQYDIVLNKQPLEDVVVYIFQSPLFIPPSNLELTYGDMSIQGQRNIDTKLTFNDTNWNKPRTITLTLHDNKQVGGLPPLPLYHNVNSDDIHYAEQSDVIFSIMMVDDGIGKINYLKENDIPIGVDELFFLREPGPSETNTFNYKISLGNPAQKEVRIDVGLSKTVPPNLSITNPVIFSPGETQKTVTFSLDGDNNPMNYEDMTIMHTIISNDPDYSNIQGMNILLSLQDDDSPEVYYLKEGTYLPDHISLIEGDEDNEYTYTIMLNTQPMNGNVIIDIAITSHPVITVSPNSLTFNNSSGISGGWDVPQIVTISIADDALYSDPSTSLTLSHEISGSSEYDPLTDKDISINVIENDACLQSDSAIKTDFSGVNYGTGTKNDPYHICNPDQLQAMKDDLNAHYILGQNINASSISTDTCPAGTTGTCTGFQPIGMDANKFKGSLDGRGYVIHDLRMDVDLVNSEFNYIGLFGFTGTGALIQNIGLENMNIVSFASRDLADTSKDVNSSYVGGLVGYNKGGIIKNSYSTGSISSASWIFVQTFSTEANSYTGGLVGYNSEGGMIQNSYSIASISSAPDSFTFFSLGGINAVFYTSYTGGLVGVNDKNGTIINSYSIGHISSSAIFGSAGGLVGPNGASIINSYSAGTALSTLPFTGGLIGNSQSIQGIKDIIRNSYFDQDIFGSSTISGYLTNTDVICTGGFTTSAFTTPIAPNTGTCDDTVPTIFFDWDPNIWNFGSATEYPILNSILQTADEQSVRMASGFLHFSNATIGQVSRHEPIFFYRVEDPSMDIITKGTNMQGVSVDNYSIINTKDVDGSPLSPPPTVNSAGIISAGSLTLNQEFHLSARFNKGSAVFTEKYRMKIGSLHFSNTHKIEESGVLLYKINDHLRHRNVPVDIIDVSLVGVEKSMADTYVLSNILASDGTPIDPPATLPPVNTSNDAIKIDVSSLAAGNLFTLQATIGGFTQTYKFKK